MRIKSLTRVILERGDYAAGRHHNWEVQLHVWQKNEHSRTGHAPTRERELEFLSEFLTKTPWTDAHAVTDCPPCQHNIHQSWKDGIDPFKCPQHARDILRKGAAAFGRGTRGKAQRLTQLSLDLQGEDNALKVESPVRL